ncbi:SDR family oxidoreductase [Clostridium sp. D2Q-11]|uniref:SDR family oxidoreductase n=1 Tax=Anaeromonas frigoriresistens TaxID=2683708 RepID=A0A942UUJ3_9FIRM|nr:SDR family oxidoreductase [Anaeromonas frigoriresistens]MBS4539504.1 SDR family oxidoreductase [Anaeromonas frigoriresistens]
MGKILLTGISGNVGSAVFEYLKEEGVQFVSGVRSPNKYEKKYPNLTFVKLDLEDLSTYKSALSGIEKVFLIRPPQLTDVEGIFKPFITSCKEVKIKQIVFLSLLGVEKNPFPPHYKIEKAIVNSGIPYTFIRPSFFMQNLSTTHTEDIRENNDLFIPSGKARVSFIDTRDIGEIIGKTLIEDGHLNEAYTLTGPEAIDYYYVADKMSKILGREIIYSNPGLLKFRKEMISRGTKKEFATVMSVLYLTTKLGMANHVTNTSEKILGRKPRTIINFIEDYKEVWM